jgi:hypothetical protein
MSFDNDLDYGTIVTNLTAKISNLNNIVTTNTDIVAQLELSPYAILTASEIARLQDEITLSNTAIVNYQVILDEITRIQALSEEEKNLIFYYYSVLGVSKYDYMLKMLFNTNMLSNENVLTLYSDVVTAPEIKLKVAKLIYNQILIDTRVPLVQFY